MSQILTNSLEYTITSENEIASILSKFNSEYLLDVIRNNLANKYVQHPSVLAPNIVGSFEQTFKSRFEGLAHQPHFSPAIGKVNKTAVA